MIEMLMIGALIFASCGALYGLICRLKAVSWRTHKAGVVLFHLLLALMCCSAIYHALEQTISTGDFLSVGVALSWLSISLKTWRHGPPSYTESDAMKLEHMR
jgi:hypothetical protein